MRRSSCIVLVTLGLLAAGCDRNAGEGEASANAGKTQPVQPARDAVAEFNKLADAVIARFPDAVKKEVPDFEALPVDARDVKKTDSILHPLEGQIRLAVKCEGASPATLVFFYRDGGKTWEYQRAEIGLHTQGASM